MEGTILKSLKEIRFISKDKIFVENLRRLLQTLFINCTINRRIGGSHKTIQYRLSIYGRENFRIFKEISFRIPMLKTRFRDLCKKYSI